jgi:murein DD-endopeptidase MepM/ murein hydrolase activator NlpD
VRRGDVVAFTGDAGYSEAPHLHYAITRRSDGAALCATREAGFADNGWLVRGG